MKQHLATLLASLGLVFGMGFMLAAPVSAVNVFDSCNAANAADSPVCKEANTNSVNNPIQTIIGLLLFAIGTISVIMIIVGGIRYVISNGEASRIKSAKDTILYAVIGLIVSLLAYAIVNFVLTQFG